ncbi:hypothetical protein E4U55_005219 [Claviceps digitariae]|nr:hypothetical protein E4U55_005219 [Claviceps digitariae]
MNPHNTRILTCGTAFDPHVFDRATSKKVYSALPGSRRCSAAPTPTESRRASAASSVGSEKNNMDNKNNMNNKNSKDIKDSRNSRDKKMKFPPLIMPSFRSVM